MQIHSVDTNYTAASKNLVTHNNMMHLHTEIAAGYDTTCCANTGDLKTGLDRKVSPCLVGKHNVASSQQYNLSEAISASALRAAYMPVRPLSSGELENYLKSKKING